MRSTASHSYISSDCNHCYTIFTTRAVHRADGKYRIVPPIFDRRIHRLLLLLFITLVFKLKPVLGETELLEPQQLPIPSKTAYPTNNTSLLDLQYSGNTAVLQRQINLLFNLTDLNADGRLNRTEFNRAVQTVLLQKDQYNAQRPLHRQLFDIFRNWFRRQKADNNSDSSINDLLFSSLSIDGDYANNGTSSNDVGDKDNEDDAIDRPTFQEYLTRIFGQHFPADYSECDLAFNRLQTCSDRRAVYELTSKGDMITVISERCRQGFGYLSGFSVERCVLAASDCSAMLDCYSKDQLHQRQSIIIRRLLSWLYLASMDDNYKQRQQQQSSASANWTISNCRSQFGSLIDCSINAVDGIGGEDSLSGSWNVYADCLHVGQDAVNSRLPRQCSPSALKTTTTCQSQLLKCVSQYRRQHAPPLNTNATTSLHKRGLWLALFSPVTAPLAPFIPLIILGMAISLPIVTTVWIRLKNEAASAHNLQLAGQTQVLVPARPGERPSHPFNPLDPTASAPSTCRPRLYWSSCGIPGSEAAKNCTAGGGRLWRPDSCAGYLHFTAGSIICGRADGKQLGDQMETTQTPSTPTRQPSGWDRFVDFIKMGPLRFQCQSLCVRFEPEGCAQ